MRAQHKLPKDMYASAVAFLDACKDNSSLNEIILEEIIRLRNFGDYDLQFKYPNIDVNAERLIKIGVIEKQPSKQFTFKIRTTEKTNKWLLDNKFEPPKIEGNIRVKTKQTKNKPESSEPKNKIVSLLLNVQRGDVLVREIKKNNEVVRAAFVVLQGLKDDQIIVVDPITDRKLPLQDSFFNKPDQEYPKLLPYRSENWDGNEDKVIGLKEALSLDIDNLKEAQVSSEENKKREKDVSSKAEKASRDESGVRSLENLNFWKGRDREFIKLCLEASLWRAIQEPKSACERVRRIIDKADEILRNKMQALPPSRGEIEEIIPAKPRIKLNLTPKLVILTKSDGTRVAAAEIGIYDDGAMRLWVEPKNGGEAFFNLTAESKTEHLKSGGRIDYVKKSEVLNIFKEKVSGIEAALLICRIDPPIVRTTNSQVKKERVSKDGISISDKKEALTNFEQMVVNSVGDVGISLIDSVIAEETRKMPEPFSSSESELEKYYSLSAIGVINRIKALIKSKPQDEVTLLHELINPIQGLGIYEREKLIDSIPNLKLPEHYELVCMIGLKGSIAKEELELKPIKDLKEFWSLKRVGVLKLSVMRVWQSQQRKFSSSLFDFADEYSIAKPDVKNFTSRGPGLSIFKDLPFHIPKGKTSLSMLLRAAEKHRKEPHDVVQLHAVFKSLGSEGSIVARWINENPDEYNLLLARGIFPSTYHSEAIPSEVTEWYNRLGMKVPDRAKRILKSGMA